MTDQPSLATLRQVLALLFPMQGIVVIGAGRGQGLEGFRSASSVLLVDARAECIEQMQTRAPEPPNAMAVQAVIAARRAPANFHLATKPDESALIPPEALQPLWRNLKTRDVDAVETLTLVDLLAGLEPARNFRCNWLVIDCLPALPVLEGAGRLIDDVDVVELRCVSDSTIAAGQGASLADAAEWLEARGFRRMLQSEEAHPLLCKAVFCRDVQKVAESVSSLQSAVTRLRQACADHAQALMAESKAKAEALTRCDLLVSEVAALERARLADSIAFQEQSKLAMERAAQVEILSHAKVAAEEVAAERAAQLKAFTQAEAAVEKLAAERQTQLDARNKEKAALAAERDAAMKEKEALAAERDALAQSKTALTRARDEQTQLAAELATRLEVLTQAKAAVERLAAERQTRVDALNNEKEALTAERDALAKAKAALSTERDTLKQSVAAGQHRQTLLQEEMSKANAQLDLIKDLLLRESRL